MVWVWAGGVENQSKTKSCSELLLSCVFIKIMTVCLFFFFFNSISIILEGLFCVLGRNGNYEVKLWSEALALNFKTHICEEA